MFYSKNRSENNYNEIEKPDEKFLKKAKKKRKVKDIVLYFPRKVRNGIVYWKKFGFTATLQRVIFGRQDKKR